MGQSRKCLLAKPSLNESTYFPVTQVNGQLSSMHTPLFLQSLQGDGLLSFVLVSCGHISFVLVSCGHISFVLVSCGHFFSNTISVLYFNQNCSK